mgnify:CR=1 FL=1
MASVVLTLCLSPEEKTQLEAKLDRFQEACQRFAQQLDDPELKLDLQADDGSALDLAALGSKYASEVLQDRAVYTLCAITASGTCGGQTLPTDSNSDSNTPTCSPPLRVWSSRVRRRPP